MAGKLYVDAAVITGDDLRHQHEDQTEVCVKPGAVLTPTAWDFVREAGLTVSRASQRAESEAATAEGTGSGNPDGGTSQAIPAEGTGSGDPNGGTSQAIPAAGTGSDTPAASIREVAPSQMVCAVRCDQPDQAFGCQTDEFGSGFAAKSADAGDKEQDGSAVPAALPAGVKDFEELIQRITDLVMQELGRQ